MYVYFGFNAPLKAYSEVLVYKKLICVVVIFPRCCLHQGKIFCVETDNGDHFSALAAHNVDVVFILFCFICVVAHNVEKSSALMLTTQKNLLR
jgi:hypothetical protein